MDKEDRANQLFTDKLSKRERAAFELGIKLGALFHMSMGMPISKDNSVVSSIEKALEKSIGCQPYVESVKVRINLDYIEGEKKDEFDYSSVNPRCLEAEIILKYDEIKTVGKLKWNKELHYPMMYIDDITGNLS